MWHPMYRQCLPATIYYPPHSRLPLLARLSFFPRLPGSGLPHGVGVGSPPTLSFFPRLPGSSLPHGVGVGSPPTLYFFPRLPGSSLPHGVGVSSPPTLYFFSRLPGSSLPHGVGVGSPPTLYFFPRLPGSSLPHGVSKDATYEIQHSSESVKHSSVIHKPYRGKIWRNGQKKAII